MIHLTCPKCRQGMPDDALDTGHCPECGFPLEGPIVLATPSRHTGGSRLLFALGGVVLLTGAGLTGYAFLNQNSALTALSTQEVPPSGVQPTQQSPSLLAPFPHELNHTDSSPPSDTETANDQKPSAPIDAEARRGDVVRPVGVMIKVNPKIAPVRNFNQPDDIATLPDLNSGDRVVLTGKLRGLRLGSVNGRGSIDASGLIAEEIIITGDLNGDAVVRLNAVRGKVTVGGYVSDAAKLTVIAPDGEILIANSARLTGGSITTITARRIDVKGPLSGNTKVHVTLNNGGALKLSLMEEGATLTYRKAAQTDSSPKVEQGELRGGAKVVAEK